MPFRKIIFWIHLAAGLVAGVVIAIMSVTGIAIAFEEEILRWTDREVRRVEKAPEEGRVPMSVDDVKRQVESDHPGEEVASIAKFRDPSLAWEVFAGEDSHLYTDPFTGKSRASVAHETHEVIHLLEEWHRWLGAKEGLESGGRLITGICNLAFVLLCVTGLWLWFPRRWSWRALRPLLLLKLSYKGKARDFNWHNVFGFWSLPVLLVLAVTAVTISFEWGHRMPFILTGEEAPKSRNYGMMAVPPPVVPAPAAGTPPLSLEAAFAKVAAAFPEWESITLEVIPDLTAAQTDPWEFGVTVPDHMPSRGYIPVKTDPHTGEILQQVLFTDRSIGLQARVWARFLHTGGAFGVPGKIIASVASAAAVVLVWTGFALSWRRFFGKKRKTAPAA